MIKKTIPSRNDVKPEDTWNLSSLYKTSDEWEADLLKIANLALEVEKSKGSIVADAQAMLTSLKLYSSLQQVSEKAGTYAFLLTATDASNSEYQDKQGRYMMAASAAEEKTSFFIPEIQSLSNDEFQTRTRNPEYTEFSVFLAKLFRLKPYILSEKEERLFALQIESNQTAQKTFSMLTNVDIDFGTVSTEKGEEPLSQTTWSSFMESPNRQLRKEAYTKFYSAFDSHKNTIASLYTGSVNLDIYQARARGYSSSLEAALYPDKVSISVYDNLINTIRNNLSPLHKYYALRKKILKVDELRHYDVYTPLVQSVKKITPYNEAVEILREALSPLGDEYTNTLCTGLTSGWVDKYENKGKRSGAFSSGAYTGYPYILMNYKDEVLRDVFTLAHEGGHSMHSYYSAKSNPFIHYGYTIFEAEVASTFNEDLLFHYYLKNSSDNVMKTYLLCNRASDILATLYRQTMFAEYEKRTHELVESGIPLSVDVLRSEYKKLLSTYFGPEMVFENESDLEGLRIPHFYNAFYVYKYATGISASLALSKRVRDGSTRERDEYFQFLKSGGSKYPIESLKIAGVNMEDEGPILSAIKTFSNIVDELEKIL